MRKQFKLIIDLENAAFEDDPCSEIADILYRLAKRIYGDALTSGDLIDLHHLKDTNGNTVGNCIIKEITNNE